MEAVGGAASVIAVVGLAAKVSASAASFMRDARDARKDMIQVRKDMSDLSTVLGMVAEDLDHDHPPPGGLPQSHQHIVGIAQGCRTVLLEIETVLRESRPRLGWASSGKERVGRLRERLETCKLSLDVALDYRTMVVVHDIKEDSTRIAGDLSAIQRDMTILLAKVENIEQKALEGQESQDGARFYDDGFVLNRFLDEYRSDAQTVLDNIDYQQDRDFEGVPPQAQGESRGMRPGLKPRSPVTAPSPTIRLKNSLGHTYDIPLEHCRTWGHMDEIIKHSYPKDSDERKEIDNGRYDLFHEEPQKCEPIRLTDCIGRKFSFPWDLAKSWKCMEEMIREAFVQVAVIGPHVQEGHYDLIGLDGTVILPATWEHFVRPDMAVSMKMWPQDGANNNKIRAGIHRGQRMKDARSSAPREGNTPIPPAARNHGPVRHKRGRKTREDEEPR